MNILLINYEFPPVGGGSSTATWHIAKELALLGHKPFVLTSAFKEKIGYDCREGVEIFRCPAIRKKVSESNTFEMLTFVISAFIIMPWFIIKHRIKGAIVFFSFPCGPLGLWANVLFNIPYIISLRGGDVPGNEKKLEKIHKILRPLRRLIFRKSKAVTANSKGLRDLAFKTDRIDISIIPNGVDTVFFKPAVRKIKKLNFDFLFVGRLSEEKNLLFFINEISIFKRRKNAGLKLHIVGDGPLKDQIINHSKTLDVFEDIILYGWIDKTSILSLYQNSDCLVMPSLYEGMPNAVLEAMACGLPIIASNVSGNNTIIRNGENGFLFNLEDSNDFQDKLEKMLEDDSARAIMGKKARKITEQQISWSKTARAYYNLLKVH